MGDGIETEKSVQPHAEGQEGQNEAVNETHEETVRRETHQRVLKESQKYKQMLSEYKTKYEEMENTRLKEQDNWKALAEKLQEENSGLKGTLGVLAIKSQLTPKLIEAGCVDVDDALALGSNDLLVHDEGQISGVEQFLEDLRQRKPYLFTSKIPSSVNTAHPSGGLKYETPKKDFSSMTLEELKAHEKLLDQQFKASR